MALPADGPRPAMSPYFFYDEYIEVEANGSRLIFVDPAMTLEEFKSKYDPVHTISLHSRDGKFRHLLPGERTQTRFHVASEAGKSFSLSLLRRLLEVEDDGKCIEDFTPDQVRVRPSGEVILKSTFLSKVAIDEDEFLDRLADNFLVAVEIIESLFIVEGDRCVPPDVEHLLGLMTDHFEDRAFFPSHAGICHLMECGSLLKDLHDLLKVKISWANYHIICDAIITDMNQNGIDWRYGVKNNMLLRETYYYGVGRSRSQYELPLPNRPNQTRLRRDQRAALKEVNLASSNPSGLTPYEERVLDGHRLLTFLRNRYAHRLEAIAAGWLTWNRKKVDLRAAHSELVTLVKFHRVLPIVQLHLYQMRYLSEPDLL